MGGKLFPSLLSLEYVRDLVSQLVVSSLLSLASIVRLNDYVGMLKVQQNEVTDSWTLSTLCTTPETFYHVTKSKVNVHVNLDELWFCYEASAGSEFDSDLMQISKMSTV